MFKVGHFYKVDCYKYASKCVYVNEKAATLESVNDKSLFTIEHAYAGRWHEVPQEAKYWSEYVNFFPNGCGHIRGYTESTAKFQRNISEGTCLTFKYDWRKFSDKEAELLKVTWY